MIKNADFSSVAVEKINPTPELPKITDWISGNHNDNGEWLSQPNLVTTESLVNFAKNSNTASITFTQELETGDNTISPCKYFALFCVKKNNGTFERFYINLNEEFVGTQTLTINKLDLNAAAVYVTIGYTNISLHTLNVNDVDQFIQEHNFVLTGLEKTF